MASNKKLALKSVVQFTFYLGHTFLEFLISMKIAM